MSVAQRFKIKTTKMVVFKKEKKNASTKQPKELVGVVDVRLLLISMISVGGDNVARSMDQQLSET